MASRKFSVTQYFDSRCAEIDPLFAFNATDESESRKWRARGLAKIRDLLGEMPDSVQLEAETIESVDMGSYVREKVVFDSDSHSSVPGYLLIPKGLREPSPTVLCLHGHGPGKDVVAGVTAPDQCHGEDEKRDYIRKFNCDYARQLAERGYVTFAFDFRCFGERCDPDCDLGARDPCNVHFIRGSLLGINLLALNIHDATRAVDYLIERPEVNRKRIGCAGLSFGGTMTMWTAALDKRVSAAVVSGYVCEFESRAACGADFCGSQFVPALRRYFDIPDICALIAPKPLLVESGTLDERFRIDSADRSFERLKRAYTAWGHPERLARNVFEGGPRFHAEAAYEWLDKWL
ncbi:MAG: hypothetical protein A2Z18_00200 [Armatimonadetes bacterium RBG_16_58_9]|nr:MAG: hypothetical protein A2Z18_00200 [Armatimonadetes bacterium RBG_16_58_9]